MCISEQKRHGNTIDTKRKIPCRLESKGEKKEMQTHFCHWTFIGPSPMVAVEQDHLRSLGRASMFSRLKLIPGFFFLLMTAALSFFASGSGAGPVRAFLAGFPSTVGTQLGSTFSRFSPCSPSESASCLRFLLVMPWAMGGVGMNEPGMEEMT